MSHVNSESRSHPDSKDHETWWQPFSQPQRIANKGKDGHSTNTIFNYFTKISSTKRKSEDSYASKKKCDINTNNLRQTYINIGQKNFGHTICPTCGMVYSQHQEDEEAQHTRFHQKIVDKLQFNGWKDERIIQEFHDGRIIMITGDDHASHLKKLSEIKEVIDAELGFATVQDSHPGSEQHAFLFISLKKVIGCAIAVHISKAFPVISQSDSESVSSGTASSSSWCCNTNHVPAICGISRLWVFSTNRRQKIASRLVDCIRLNFLYGCVIVKEKLAFSDPTPNGRSFAEKYMGESPVLVFS